MAAASFQRYFVYFNIYQLTLENYDRLDEIRIELARPYYGDSHVVDVDRRVEC